MTTASANAATHKIYLDSLLAVTNDIVIFLSPEKIITEMSANTEKLLAWERREIIGNTFESIYQKKQLVTPFSHTEFSALLNGETSHIKNVITLKNGNQLNIDWTFSALKTTDHSTSGYLIKGKDISDSLKSNKEQLEKISACVPGNFYWKNKKLEYLGCNQSLLTMLDLNSFDDIVGKTDYDLWPEQADAIRKNDMMVMKTGETIFFEESVLMSEKNNMYFTVIKMPLLDERGQVIGILGNSLNITELKNTQINLKIAKEAAEAANQAKDVFIAEMSHDIRTPLSGIMGLSTMMKDGAHNADEKENAFFIYNSGEKLLGLLNGILDVAAADNLGIADIHNKSFELRKLIDDIVQLELPTTKFKHLDLLVKIDDAVPNYIISDRTKLHRILLNLLGNAIKFTKTGSITIGITSLDNTAADIHLQFDVADTGIGIPLELQDKVFDRFYRVTPSYKGTYEGHGIGLDIAQSYVTLLGGHITLTSQEGVGTTFHFDLPCKIGNKEDVLPQESTMSFQEKMPPKPPTPSTMVNTAPSKPQTINTDAPCILLVEDNPVALKVLESLVVSTGCRCQSVIDGEHALELATTHPFDLIITDIGLPGISGHEFTKRFRDWEKSNQKKPIPVVGLTAHVRQTAIKECLLCGMDDVFSKPANLPMIQSILSEYHLQDKYRETQVTQTQDAPSPPASGKLGKDLPDTVDELFAMDSFLMFDPKYLLIQTGNDESLAIELLNTFIADQTQQDIHEMMQAYDKKDWGAVEKLAHKLKGGAGYLGTHRMFYACQYLERYYKAGHRDIGVLEQLFHQLININKETIKTIESWLNQNKKK